MGGEIPPIVILSIRNFPQKILVITHTRIRRVTQLLPLPDWEVKAKTLREIDLATVRIRP